jgi:hypothetical protein
MHYNERSKPIKGTIMKTFEDGSELTTSHIVVGSAAALAGGVALFKLGEWISDKRTKRWMKKNNWPQESIDRY